MKQINKLFFGIIFYPLFIMSKLIPKSNNVWIFVSWLVTLLGACVAAEMAVLASAVVPAPRMRPVMGLNTDADQNRSRKNR